MHQHCWSVKLTQDQHSCATQMIRDMKLKMGSGLHYQSHMHRLLLLGYGARCSMDKALSRQAWALNRQATT